MSIYSKYMKPATYPYCAKILSLTHIKFMKPEFYAQTVFYLL